MNCFFQGSSAFVTQADFSFILILFHRLNRFYYGRLLVYSLVPRWRQQLSLSETQLSVDGDGSFNYGLIDRLISRIKCLAVS